MVYSTQHNWGIQSPVSDLWSEEEQIEKRGETPLLNPRIKKGPPILFSDGRVSVAPRDLQRSSIESSLSLERRSVAGSPEQAYARVSGQVSGGGSHQMPGRMGIQKGRKGMQK